jgi:hypothetical protein
LPPNPIGPAGSGTFFDVTPKADGLIDIIRPTCLCHQNGILEQWNAGILGIRAEIYHFNCEKFLQTHYSISPSFHYSNWGEAPNLSCSKFTSCFRVAPGRFVIPACYYSKIPIVICRFISIYGGRGKKTNLTEGKNPKTQRRYSHEDQFKLFSAKAI